MVSASPASIAADGSTTTITVTAKDADGNAVSGATVVLGASGTGNALTQPAGTTNGSGVATGTLSSTVAEGKTVSATINGVGITQTAAVTVTAGAAAQMALHLGDGQSAPVGTAVAVPPSVLVTDAHGNPVAGVSVTFAVTGGGGSLTGETATTDASGIATVGSWTLGTTAGSNTLTATSGSLTGSPVTFTATGTAGAAVQIAVAAGDGQTATAGMAVGTPPEVLVTDVYGNPVSGVSVTFAVASGDGAVDPTTAVVTGSNGIASVTSWTLGPVVGTNTLTATATGTGITGNPVTFTATGT
jgi:adhesin/invasin